MGSQRINVFVIQLQYLNYYTFAIGQCLVNRTTPTKTQDVHGSLTLSGRRPTTAQPSRNAPTSVTADSEELLKEFEAIKKLKLFAGLGRLGRRSAGGKTPTTDGGGRAQHEVDPKQSTTSTQKTTADPGRGRARVSTTAGSTAGKLVSKSESMNAGRVRRLPVDQMQSPRPGNGSTSTQQVKSTVVSARQKTGGVAVGATAAKLAGKTGQKTGSKLPTSPGVSRGGISKRLSTTTSSL